MRRSAFAALLLARLTTPALAADLRITVYDQAHLSRPMSRAAFDWLRDVFRNAGITAEVVPWSARAK